MLENNAVRIKCLLYQPVQIQQRTVVPLLILIEGGLLQCLPFPPTFYMPEEKSTSELNERDQDEAKKCTRGKTLNNKHEIERL